MRVVTYNLRGGLGTDGHRSLERVAHAVSAFAPDIACFQEVYRRFPPRVWSDQPRQLSRLLGLPILFQANVRVPFGGYGLAVATRFPVLTVRRRFLPSVRERRGALQVTVQLPDGEPLTVFCTHWGLRQSEREQQAATLAQWVNAAPSPVIVCGDFNEEPTGSAWRLLLAQTGLEDADAGGNRPTYPADAPRARIDAVFHAPALRVLEVNVPPALASDHLPVCAKFGGYFVSRAEK